MQDQFAQENWPKEWRAWTTLMGCFFLMFNSWGLVNAYGTFQSIYMNTLLPNKDLLLLNLIGSTESFFVLAGSFIVGRVLDAGLHKYLLGVGTVLVSLSMFLLSVINGGGNHGEGNYGLIWLCQGALLGMGMACFFVSSSQIAATWFLRRKSFAIGIVASGASISGLIYPIMTRFLTEQVGFNDAVKYVAAVVTFTALISFCLANPNPAHIYRKPKKWMATEVWVDSNCFKDTAMLWLIASISFMFFGFYAVFFNLENWSVEVGIGYRDPKPEGIAADAQPTFFYLAIMNACSTIGRIVSAYLCDKFGALRIHAISMIVSSILIYFLWTFAKTMATGMAFSCIFGAFSGAVIGLPPASVANILGKSKERQSKLGQWTGMMYTISAIPALVGPVIAGHLITEFDNNYLTVEMWSGTCLLLAGICLIMAMFNLEKEVFMSYASTARASMSTVFPSRLSISDPEKRNGGLSGRSTRAQSRTPSTRAVSVGGTTTRVESDSDTEKPKEEV
ncbi:MFS general substrate transporter [Aulographum hederae CBS 113979]|uniref:MFS general substrate transporter n=1 Tax=Aulographum hederae CBS 113979 TaxID=1176131 RepID=A0A6G1H5S0_9PEZI|nr:MFS general substrate transporter [Aulographum hederae CBS 113979]